MDDEEEEEVVVVVGRGGVESRCPRYGTKSNVAVS